MKKITYTIIIAILPNFCWGTALTQLSTKLEALKTISTSFNQTIYNDNNQILQQATGTMHYARPNQFRWEVQTPEKLLIVANEKKIYNYDIELEQITVQKADNFSTPAILLAGDIQRIEQLFLVQKAKDCKANYDCYLLYPKDDSANLQWIYIDFTKDNKLHALNFLDTLNQKTQIKFSKITVNENLNKNLFDFTPPKNVDVFGEMHNAG